MSISRAKRFTKKRKRAQTNLTGEKSRFKRGFYKPINENKYKQPMDTYMNSSIFPEYRSSWELKFMKWLDMNGDVEYWTTEPFAIKYFDSQQNKTRRYFPDFLVKFKDGKKFVIEIKPLSQTDLQLNLDKWTAAKKFCEGMDLSFHVMTEKELGIK